MRSKLSYLFFGALAAFFGAYLAFLLREDFKTLDGQTHNWQNLQGQWVVVNYFAQWCVPCIKEIPELNDFAEFANQRSDVALFAVNFDLLTPAESQTMVEEFGIEFDIMQEGPARAPFARPKTLPATFIISPQGELMVSLNGEQTNQGLQMMIEQLAHLE